MDGRNPRVDETAQKSGVKRFVFVSAYGGAQNHPVDFFRMKFAAEEYLKSLNMNYTILRPTAFMESWCARIGARVMNDQPGGDIRQWQEPNRFILRRMWRGYPVSKQDPRTCEIKQ
ncbi:MAG: NAD(P)H-binding protein [Anaerolineales bacterium]